MNRLLTLTLVLALPMFGMAKKAKVYKKATMECPAYNDMKHRNNSNKVELKVGEEYRILQENKGQILTLIEGERIAQRWVDQQCFGLGEKKVSESTKTEEKKSTLGSLVRQIFNKDKKSLSSVAGSKAKQNLLAISWQNAFCQTHQYKKECKKMRKGDFGATNFVLHGLWPQPRNNQYCNVSKKEVGKDKNKQWHRLSNLELNSTTREQLSKLMPGYSSNLHKHEWIKHGTCYGTSANAYYDDAMNLLTQVNQSEVRDYFKKNIGRTIYLKDVRKVFDKEFGKGSGNHVTMNCRRGLITELWLHLGNNSSSLSGLLSKGEKPKSRCFKGRVDAVGF